MTFQEITTDIKNQLNAFSHSDWLGSLLLAIVFLLATIICSHVASITLRRILHSKHGPLPAASIFINIARVIVWAIGLSIILSTCFNINVQAAVTALGIGGIAISLGFQTTLSNMIGGVQILLFGIVEPGDRIKVGANEGVVKDITWGYTTIVNVRDETVLIPNSVVSTDALIKMPPLTDVRLNIVIPDTANGAPIEALDTLVPKMQTAVDDAVEAITALETKTQISVNGRIERGYTALLTLAVVDGSTRAAVVDAIMKAISKATHATGDTAKDAS